MTLAFGLALLLNLGPKFDFYTNGPYDPSVPKPETVLGYGPGERHTPFRDQELTLNAIAGKAGAKVREFRYGATNEGRPLRVFAVSSPRNIARLDELKRRMADLNAGRGSVSPDMPTFVWVNECIHGNETASFESAMWLLYTLAASKPMEKTLDDVVVLLNPVYNPDGHERFVVWFNSVARGTADGDSFEQDEPGIIGGRTNHYRFDMNRDRVAMSQKETREEVAEFLRWTPQVYIDQHGQVESYFFPPTALSVNANLDRARVDKWMEVFGRATSRAFDQQGWAYFIKDTFDFFYPGYLDSWTSLSGAIGMTHETDGGRFINYKREDGSILTLRDGIQKHFTSALAVIRSAAQNRQGLLESFASFKKGLVDGKQTGKFQRVVVTSDDPRPLKRLAEQLARGGVASRFAASFSQKDAHDYWSTAIGEQAFPAGSLVIDMNQPQGALAKSLLEPTSDFEPEFTKEQLRRREAQKAKQKYPRAEGAEFYDMTAWALPYAYNLKAWWCESRPEIQPWVEPKRAWRLEDSPVGYLLPYRDQEDALGAMRLLLAGVRVQALTAETQVDGKTFAPGTFLIPSARNDEGYEAIVRRELAGLDVHALKSGYPDSGRQGTGSENVASLKKPSIAIVFGDTDNPTGFGSVWYQMDEVFHLPFTAIPRRRLAGDLSDFTCIVCPGGMYDPVSDSLKNWIQEGGSLVLLGGSRLAGERSLVPLEPKESGSVPGAIFLAALSPKYPLAYGYSAQDGDVPFAVPVDGGRFFKTAEAGGGVVRFLDAPRTLSGWSWPDETEKDLAETTWLHDQPMGRGHVVFFSQDPTERAMWPGLNKLFLNSILLGRR